VRRRQPRYSTSGTPRCHSKDGSHYSQIGARGRRRRPLTTMRPGLADPLVAPGTARHTTRRGPPGRRQNAVPGRTAPTWKSWVPRWLPIALGSGLVVAGGVAGRRTATASSRFDAPHGFDVLTLSFTSLPQIARHSDVASIVTALTPGVRPTATARARVMRMDSPSTPWRRKTYTAWSSWWRAGCTIRRTRPRCWRHSPSKAISTRCRLGELDRS
jgi:hypothetical protein